MCPAKPCCVILSWFQFERQAYANEKLDPLVQHAVILGKPDPFGLTILDCNRGTPVCRFATDLRDEFFEANAFLRGRGELILQYRSTKTVAGYAPVSIYFLLSSLDIMEPLQLAATTINNKPPTKPPRGRRIRNAPLFANHDDGNKLPP